MLAAYPLKLGRSLDVTASWFVKKVVGGFCNYRTKWTAIFFIFGTFDHGTKFFADPLWTLQVQIFRDIPWLNVRLQHLDHLWIIWLRKSSVVPWSRNDPWSWASCVLAEKKSNSKVFTDDSVWIKIYPYPLLIHSKNWEQWLWLHPNPPLCTPSLRSVIPWVFLNLWLKFCQRQHHSNCQNKRKWWNVRQQTVLLSWVKSRGSRHVAVSSSRFCPKSHEIHVPKRTALGKSQSSHGLRREYDWWSSPLASRLSCGGVSRPLWQLPQLPPLPPLPLGVLRYVRYVEMNSSGEAMCRTQEIPLVTQFWCFIDRDTLAVHWCLAVPCSALHSLCFVNFMLCRCNTARGFPNRCPSGWLRKGSWFLEAWTAECHAMAIMAIMATVARLGGPGKARLRVLEDPNGLVELKESFTVGQRWKSLWNWWNV